MLDYECVKVHSITQYNAYNRGDEEETSEK